MDINELLRASMQWGATDVHLVVPAPPMLRLCHELVPIDREPLTAAAVKAIFESINMEKQQDIFYKELEFGFCLQHLWCRALQGQCIVAEGQYRAPHVSNQTFQKDPPAAELEIDPVQLAKLIAIVVRKLQQRGM